MPSGVSLAGVFTLTAQKWPSYSTANRCQSISVHHHVVPNPLTRGRLRRKNLAVSKTSYSYTPDKVSRSEMLLQEISMKGGISPAGHDFLVAALDPMHDNQLNNLSGWPDVESAPSIVRCIKQSATITCAIPATSLTGTWDCHVCLQPVLAVSPSNICTMAGGLISAKSDAVSLGGLSVLQGVSGNDLNFAYPGSAIYSPVSMSIDASYLTGVGRVIGIGVECVNTTAEIYKQGTITAYRMSQGAVRPQVLSRPVGESFPFATYHIIRNAPQNVQEAMLYPGTRQWRAADGIYQVAPFVGSDNPPLQPNYVQPIISDTDITYYDALESVNVNVAAPYSNTALHSYKIEPIHTVGFFLTGLSKESSFNIQWNVYYESFPSIDEKDILVLAKPSAFYDPVALEVLSHVLSVLPVGVPASWNASGDWFSDVVGMIGEYAPKVGELLGAALPGAGLLGDAVGTMANAYKTKYLAPPGNTAIKNGSGTAAAQKQKQEVAIQNAASVARSAPKRRARRKTAQPQQANKQQPAAPSRRKKRGGK